jgi:hypothetical protein
MSKRIKMPASFPQSVACEKCGSLPGEACSRAPGREHRGPRVSFHIHRVQHARTVWRAIK